MAGLLLALCLAAGAPGGRRPPPQEAGEAGAEALRAPLEEIPLGLPAEALSASRPAPAEEALGRELFFDPLLSRDRSIACASCHRPEHGFADVTPLSQGVGGKTLRNAPTLYNRALGTSFMWDGRAATLEQQVLLPIENELEMALPLGEAVARLAEEGGYAARFQQAFGRGPDEHALARALAAFVRGRLHGASAVDRFRAGEIESLTPTERAGMWLFESRGGCWRCHVGGNFSDEGFHNTGVGARAGTAEEGRLAVTGRAEDRGRFKTPTLRGLTETAPYMHDGSLASLEEVVEFYRRGGEANPGLDPLLRPLELAEDDVRSLAAFLRALSRRE